jgi:hypothetical protein
MSIQEQRHITSIKMAAADIKNNPTGFPARIFPDEIGSDYYIAWTKIKPEMYAIMAVLIDSVVPQGIETQLARSSSAFVRDNLGSVKNEHDLFEKVYLHTGVKLTNFIKHARTYALREHNHPLYAVWERFNSLDGFLMAYIRNLRRDASDTILARGVGTATKTMANLLEVIPQVYAAKNPQERLDPYTLAAIAHNSYPLVTELAMLHFEDFLDTRDRLEQEEKNDNTKQETNEADKSYDPRNFTFRQTAHGYTLVAKNPSFIHNDYQNELIEPRVGCPAMVNFGDGSAIQKLWQWHVNMAPGVYQTYIDVVSQS